MTKEEFQKLLDFHDWFYEYADGLAYYNGKAEEAKIFEAIREGGEEFREMFANYKKTK